MFIPLDIPSLHKAYREQSLSPADVVDYVIERSTDFDLHNIWISQLSRQQIQPYLAALDGKSIDALPLYGIPFAIKDNIDLANIDTTAGCEAFRYTPESSAYVVDCLIAAGAIPIGKTNLDQFATGLVGTRSPEPWGPCANSINPDYISGGSSSGSAVAVALGLVSFSLGTDTAGSGRVPAMLNNIVGHKPSKGLFSMSGVVPACRSLDCPSVFALTAGDAKQVFDVAANFDANDGYARPSPHSNSPRHWGAPSTLPVIGVPLKENLNFFGNRETEDLFWMAVERWKSIGATIIEVDIQPLLDAATLLYQGPWVAERYAAIERLIETQAEAIHPVVRGIIQTAVGKTAVETFQYEYKMQDYRRLSQTLFESFDFLISPTAPTTYTVDELLEDPLQLNSNMGYYTNYMNLLDLAGTAVPAGFMQNGLPFGITLVAPAMNDQMLLSYAHQWQCANNYNAGALNYTPKLLDPRNVSFENFIRVAVCGAHLDGMPLNWQLTERGATLIQTTTTSKAYELYALAGGPPHRPGLKRVTAGTQIEIEIWQVPQQNFGSFVAGIPAPLGIGKVETADGEWLSSFICEPYGLDDAEDISSFGGWRSYIESVGSLL
jgi:allophanate hydrolase